MSRAVRVKVRPGEPLRFPAQCVYCGAAAEPALRLRRRMGRVTREVSVPLCDNCQKEVQRLSFDEERWQKQGWLAAALASIVLFVALLFLLPGLLPFGFRLLLALAAAVLAAVAIISEFRRRTRSRARPEKQAILAASRLEDFSWRAMTLVFADEAFARRFAELNEPQLMEALSPHSEREVVT
jgi:ABC-type multidrug transport system fused ATPase/permease subunit